MKIKVVKSFAVLADIAVVLYLVYQQFYWVWYYGASVEGALYLTSDETKFFRNYMTTPLIFAVFILVSFLSIFLYRKFRKKESIGRKYLFLVIFNIILTAIMPFEQICTIIYFAHSGDLII